MKSRKNDRPKKEVKISYRVTSEGMQFLETESKRKGYGSISKYLDYKLFSRQRRKGFEYPGLINIMLLKGINDVKYQLVHLSRTQPENLKAQETLVEIHKTLCKIHDDFRR